MKYLLLVTFLLITGCGVSVHFGPPTLGQCIDKVVARYGITDEMFNDPVLSIVLIGDCRAHKNDYNKLFKDGEE